MKTVSLPLGARRRKDQSVCVPYPVLPFSFSAPCAPHRAKARKDPQRILVLSVPQATQLAPGASENGWQTSEIVGTVSSFSEDVSVYAQSPTIAKSLACRDTQGNENREQ